MNAGAAREPGRAGAWLLVVPPVLALVVGAALFLPQQAVWVDETTQLSGLRLGPLEVVAWLTGRAEHFDVPSDCMPPLSYWVGMAWSALWGGDEASLRWLAVTLTALSTALVVLAARRAWGAGAALAAGLLFATSPNVIAQAVNIRAYPLLMLLSAGAFLCLLRLVESVQRPVGRWIGRLAACLLLCVYTHPFGLVPWGALLLGALWVVVRARGAARGLVRAGLLSGVLAVGVVPFVRACFLGFAAETPVRDRVAEVARLVYRLVAHPATATSSVALALAALGVTGLLVASVSRKLRAADGARAILAALLAGGLVVVTSNALFAGTSSAQPEYSAWMLPGLFLLLSSGLVAERRGVRRLALAAVLCLGAANIHGTAQLARHGTVFSRVRMPEIAALVSERGLDDVAVVHEGAGAPWGHVYFPLVFTFGRELSQFVAAGTDPARVRSVLDEHETLDPADLRAGRVVVLQARFLSAGELAESLGRGPRALADGPVAARLQASPAWRLVSRQALLASCQVDALVFEQRR